MADVPPGLYGFRREPPPVPVSRSSLRTPANVAAPPPPLPQRPNRPATAQSSTTEKTAPQVPPRTHPLHGQHNSSAPTCPAATVRPPAAVRSSVGPHAPREPSLHRSLRSSQPGYPVRQAHESGFGPGRPVIDDEPTHFDLSQIRQFLSTTGHNSRLENSRLDSRAVVAATAAAAAATATNSQPPTLLPTVLNTAGTAPTGPSSLGRSTNEYTEDPAFANRTLHRLIAEGRLLNSGGVDSTASLSSSKSDSSKGPFDGSVSITANGGTSPVTNCLSAEDTENLINQERLLRSYRGEKPVVNGPVISCVGQPSSSPLRAGDSMDNADNGARSNVISLVGVDGRSPSSSCSTTASICSSTVTGSPDRAVSCGFGVTGQHQPSANILKCTRCHGCRCTNCQEPQPLACNDDCVACIEMASCVPFVKMGAELCINMRRQVEPDDLIVEDPCSCSEPGCVNRHVVMGLCCPLCPLLVLYWPLMGVRHLLTKCYNWNRARRRCRCPDRALSTDDSMAFSDPPLAPPSKHRHDHWAGSSQTAPSIWSQQPRSTDRRDQPVTTERKPKLFLRSELIGSTVISQPIPLTRPLGQPSSGPGRG